MLKAPVTPLSAYQPVCKPRGGNPRPNNKAANAVKTTKALLRYKKAVGLSWTPTATVAARMGVASSYISKTLRKYHDAGIIERRPYRGEPYNKNKGYEWRVK
jgi:hypothetical protein